MTCDQIVESVRAGERPGCEHCGEPGVRVEVEVVDSVQIHEMIRLKANGERKGPRKVFLEGKSGDEDHRDDQRWTRMSRTVNHDNDRYDEIIIDAVAGEVVNPISLTRQPPRPVCTRIAPIPVTGHA